MERPSRNSVPSLLVKLHSKTTITLYNHKNALRLPASVFAHSKLHTCCIPYTRETKYTPETTTQELESNRSLNGKWQSSEIDIESNAERWPRRNSQGA
jgi:hypothetical protein